MLQIKELSRESFAQYGTFLNPLDCGEPLDGSLDDPVQFFPDRMMLTFPTSNVLAFSPIVIRPRPMLITDIEYHEFTEELIGGFSEDVCFYAAPAGQLDVGKIEVFRLPAGWWVRFKRGVWHKAPYVLTNRPTSGLVALPPHTYTADCHVVELAEPIAIAFKGEAENGQ